MRMQGIALTCALSIMAGGAAWSEEYRGTWEQQMACTPDVWRLCSDQIPDTNRIVSCLRINTPQLSNGCRAVFESNARGRPNDTARAAPQSPPRAPNQRPARPQATQPQTAQPQSSNPWYDQD